MLLYRAQAVPSGRRIRTPLDNARATRIAGRWFTDDLAAAWRHLDSIQGPRQIVCVEIADELAETFRVSQTPFTTCGLQPVDHTDTPERDFVIPRFFAVQAEEVERVADEDLGEVVSLDLIDLRLTRNGRLAA